MKYYQQNQDLTTVLKQDSSYLSLHIFLNF